MAASCVVCVYGRKCLQSSLHPLESTCNWVSVYRTLSVPAWLHIYHYCGRLWRMSSGLLSLSTGLCPPKARQNQFPLALHSYNAHNLDSNVAIYSSQIKGTGDVPSASSLIFLINSPLALVPVLLTHTLFLSSQRSTPFNMPASWPVSLKSSGFQNVPEEKQVSKWLLQPWWVSSQLMGGKGKTRRHVGPTTRRAGQSRKKTWVVVVFEMSWKEVGLFSRLTLLLHFLRCACIRGTEFFWFFSSGRSHPAFEPGISSV